MKLKVGLNGCNRNEKVAEALDVKQAQAPEAAKLEKFTSDLLY